LEISLNFFKKLNEKKPFFGNNVFALNGCKFFIDVFIQFNCISKDETSKNANQKTAIKTKLVVP
jgi:hypothetical protein